MLSTLPVVNSDFFNFERGALCHQLYIVRRHCFLDVLKFASLGRKKWIVLICRIYLLRVSFWFQHGPVVPDRRAIWRLSIWVMSGCCGIRLRLPVTFHGIKDQQLGNHHTCNHAHPILLTLFVTVDPYKINCSSARSKYCKVLQAADTRYQMLY